MTVMVMERLSNRKWRELLGGYILGTTKPWGKPHGFFCFGVLIMHGEESEEGWAMAG